MSDRRIHGQIEDEGPYAGSRWCDACRQHHGPLYQCPGYSDALIESISDQQRVHGEEIGRILDDPDATEEERTWAWVNRYVFGL